MRRRRTPGKALLAWLSTATLILLGVAATEASVGRAAAATSASTVPAWTGTFDNFHTSPWIAEWGTTSDTAQCQGASGAFACNWGYGNMKPVADSSAPRAAGRRCRSPTRPRAVRPAVTLR